MQREGDRLHRTVTQKGSPAGNTAASRKRVHSVVVKRYDACQKRSMERQSIARSSTAQAGRARIRFNRTAGQKAGEKPCTTHNTHNSPRTLLWVGASRAPHSFSVTSGTSRSAVRKPVRTQKDRHAGIGDTSSPERPEHPWPHNQLLCRRRRTSFAFFFCRRRRLYRRAGGEWRMPQQSRESTKKTPRTANTPETSATVMLIFLSSSSGLTHATSPMYASSCWARVSSSLKCSVACRFPGRGTARYNGGIVCLSPLKRGSITPLYLLCPRPSSWSGLGGGYIPSTAISTSH